MTKTVQIRNVPDAVLKRLKLRAAHAGMSLSEHLALAESMGATLITCDRSFDKIPERRAAVELWT